MVKYVYQTNNSYQFVKIIQKNWKYFNDSNQSMLKPTKVHTYQKFVVKTKSLGIVSKMCVCSVEPGLSYA